MARKNDDHAKDHAKQDQDKSRNTQTKDDWSDHASNDTKNELRDSPGASSSPTPVPHALYALRMTVCEWHVRLATMFEAVQIAFWSESGGKLTSVVLIVP